MSIFPNPSEQYVTIALPEGAAQISGHYVVYSTEGITVGTGSFLGASVKLHTDQWAKGIYHVMVVSASGSSYTGKIIKQ